MSNLDTNSLTTDPLIGTDTDKDKTNTYLKVPLSLLYDDPKREDGYGAFYTDYKFVEGYYKKYYAGTKINTMDHMITKKVMKDGEPKDEYETCYNPSNLKLRKVAKLINKQARFMFGAEPDIKLKLKMDIGEEDEAENTTLSVTKEMLDNIIERTAFMSKLLIASKDCSIGKRVAAVINFNPDSGVTIEFLPSLNFVYEYDATEKDKLNYFAFFRPLVVSTTQGMKNYYIKKVYKLIKMKKADDEIDRTDPTASEYKDQCYVKEIVYDENSKIVTDQYQREHKEMSFIDGFIDLEFIPAEVIINNGLLGDTLGVSDVEDLEGSESWYNAINDGNIDALRQSMNPMKYTVDMDTTTTKFMTNKPGGYVDLLSDRKNADNVHAEVGLLESQLNFAEPLDNVLKMIEREMYDFVDVPMIDLETMAGTITSGKALKALYWGLIIRCDEKMKTWSPSIKRIMTMVLEGCYTYPGIAQRYLGNESFPSRLEFEIEVKRNNPLPEDEEEKKTIAIQEVNAQVMSRKTYMKEILKMNDDQADAELIQIALEMNMLDNQAIPLDGLSDNSLYNALMPSTGAATTTSTVATETEPQVTAAIETEPVITEE